MENIQIIPVVTEKANAITEKGNRYTFKESTEANKYQIRDLIEELYDVKVVEIKTMNYDGKKRQRYTRTGIQRGATAAFKKAIVTLAEGQTIDFYSNL